MSAAAFANPAAWALVAGICLGASFAFFIPRPRSSRRRREGRLAAAIAFLSLCVAGLMAGFLLCGPGPMVETERLVLGAVAAAVALLGFSFPLAAGLPMAGLAGAWVIALAVLFSAWIPVDPTGGAAPVFMTARARGSGTAWFFSLAETRSKPGRPKAEARADGDAPVLSAAFESVEFAEVYKALGFGLRVTLKSAKAGSQERAYPLPLMDGVLKTYGPRLGIEIHEHRLEDRPFSDFESCGIIWTVNEPAWKP